MDCNGKNRRENKNDEKVSSLFSIHVAFFFFYLQISMVIHYALMEGNNTIACFEVPAKITN